MDLNPQIDLFTPPVFFDTIDLNEEEKRKAEIAAKKGNAQVLSIFKENPNLSFTPRQIHLLLIGQGYDYELTSVRRAITTLTNAFLLVKNHKDFQRVESKGTKNFTWKLA